MAGCDPSNSSCPWSVFRQKRWNPYVVGALIGVLSWVTFAAMGKALGTSTTIPKVAGAATHLVAPEYVDANAYYGKYFNADKGKVLFDWQFFLVVGLGLGAFASARLSGDRFKETVPVVWEKRFGPSKLLRFGAAFAGGFVMILGARLAGGCTSGHGISGGLQFAASSWLFFAAMFAAGVVTTFALFGMKGRSYVDA